MEVRRITTLLWAGWFDGGLSNRVRDKQSETEVGRVAEAERTANEDHRLAIVKIGASLVGDR